MPTPTSFVPTSCLECVPRLIVLNKFCRSNSRGSPANILLHSLESQCRPANILTSESGILVQPSEHLTSQTSFTLQLEGADGIKNMQKKGLRFVLVASEPLFAINTRNS